jgi:hypothetical protein
LGSGCSFYAATGYLSFWATCYLSFSGICFGDVAFGRGNPFDFDFVSEVERVGEYSSREPGESDFACLVREHFRGTGSWFAF